MHSWEAGLDLGQLTPYGPRNFEMLGTGKLPEIAKASRIYFVTNAPASDLTTFSDWQIVRP